MLAEILTFSLLAGAIVVFDTYQVFFKSRLGASDEFRTRVIETTLFGTVPGVVGACVATPTLTESEAAYVLFIVFTSLFLLSLFVRYADLGRRSGVFWSGLTESTSVFLVGSIACVSIGTVPGTSPVAPCLLYVSLYYFWAADLGDDSSGGSGRPRGVKSGAERGAERGAEPDAGFGAEPGPETLLLPTTDSPPGFAVIPGGDRISVAGGWY